MLGIVEALKERTAERIREVLVPVPGTDHKMRCKLIRLGDSHYTVATADSHDRVMEEQKKFNPAKNTTFPRYQDVVEYLTEPTGKFFFTRPELEQLLQEQQYTFRTARLFSKGQKL